MTIPAASFDGSERDRPSEDAAAVVARLAAAIAEVGPDGSRPGESVSAEPPPTKKPQSRARAARGHSDGRGESADPATAAREICLRLLAVQPRSRADLAKALRQRGVEDDVAESVLDRLTEVRLIDDAAYARLFVTSKHRSRGLGRAALRNELRKHGIDKDLVERAVADVDDDAERDKAAELVAKKLDAAMFSGLQSARRRLLGMLARRGYSTSVALSVVNEALDGYVEPIDDVVEEEAPYGGSA